MNTREQGDFGEMSAAYWLASKGYAVAIPFGHSPDWDLVARIDGRHVAVQVKTSNCYQRERWLVSLCTRGGNRSWSGIVKRMDASRCDFIFAHVGDGRRWFIPIEAVEGGTAICLGGPKYSEFEVEPSDPLPTCALRVAV